MKCPKCNSENTYQDGLLWICPECSHEWVSEPDSKATSSVMETVANSGKVIDCNGRELADGDAVIVIKDLAIKGTSSKVKSGTKVKNIKLLDAGDGHNFSGKIDGLGTINLKSEFVRKV